MKASQLQGADDRVGSVSPARQDDGPIVGLLEMGDVCPVSASSIGRELEMRVDDADWSDETRCWWKGKSVGGAGIGRAKGRQGETGNVFSPATRAGKWRWRRARGH